MKRLVAIALASVGGLTSPAEEPATPQTECPIRPFFWCAPEFASGHISIGRVKVVHPVHNFDAGMGAEYKPVGYAVAGVWSLTDLSSSYTDRRYPFWNEIDPLVGIGRKFELAEGYVFDSFAAAQWNCMAGYKGNAFHSYDEWQIRETLATPYGTPWFAMRNFYWPVAKASFRVGIAHVFRLTDDLSLEPNVWTDGGSERWNEQRFGYQNPKRIGSGLNSVSVRLFTSYRLVKTLRLFGGITGYWVIDPDARAELTENPAEESRKEYAVVTCGFRCDL